MSTLSRGDEIATDFYHLKAQEWACEPNEAKLLIERALINAARNLKLARGWTPEKRNEASKKAAVSYRGNQFSPLKD